MLQGAKANNNGILFEKSVEQFLVQSGHTVYPSPRYKAVWHGGRRLNETDIYLKDIDTQIECKFQDVGGTADQKYGSEIQNAYEKIRCEHYILLYGGAHWDKPRGNNIYKAAQRLAALYNKLEDKPGAKKISVMKLSEFKEWINEQS